MTNKAKNPLILDAADTVFFKRELENIKAQVYEQPLRPLKYAECFPIDASAPAGATQITRRRVKGFGIARLIADWAHDFPMVDIAGEEFSVKIKDYGVAYGYTMKDIQRAAMTGTPLETQRAKFARRATEQKLNEIAWVGDSAAGIQGFIKYPGTTEYVVPATGTGSSKLWSTKTPDQIMTDLNGLFDAVYVGTNGMEQPDTLLLPLAKLQILRNTRMGTYNDTTILDFFMRQHPGVEIKDIVELKNAGTGGTIDVGIAYKKDPMYVVYDLITDFEQHDAVQEGLAWKIPCTAEAAGVSVIFPATVAWMEGF